MATSKPISTISYNSEEYLHYKLESWLKAHIIQSYQYIKHKGEDGDKDHIHLRIEPNKKLDPMDLQDELKEYVSNNDKPLGCRPFRPSIEEDWFLYVVHDQTYLRYKYGGGDKKEKIPYKWQNIIVPDDYDLEIAFIRAKAKLEHTSCNLADRLKKGESPINLILEGENPHTVNALMTAVKGSEYSYLANKYNRLQVHFEQLLNQLLPLGYKIEYDKEDKLQLFASTNSEQK